MAKMTERAESLKNEMIEHVRKQFGREADEFDIEAAIWWFANDHYAGMGDPMYEILSASEFEPGRAHRSVEDEGDMAAEIYEELESEFGE